MQSIKDFAFLHRFKENDISYVNIYLLQEKHGIEIAFSGDVFLRHFTNGPHRGTFSLSFDENVSDENVRQAIEILLNEAKMQATGLVLSRITNVVREKLEALYPCKWHFEEDRNYAEYIHKTESLAKMVGKKFSSKRNHISHFLQECPDFEVVPINPQNVKDAETVARAWLIAHESDTDGELKAEYEVIKKALSEWEELNLCGILLYVGGYPIAMSVASEMSSGVWDIHFEKVMPEYPRAWAVIVKNMAEYLKDSQYINREEDIGQEGLRKSKLSYRPDIINQKYNAYLIEE